MNDMTEDEFYKTYFRFIESIQCIENRLRFMYSHIRGIEDNSAWYDDYKAVECDTIGKLVNLIKKEEEKRGTIFLSDEMCSRLDEIREKRNFWVHKCCIEGFIGFKKKTTGSVLKPLAAQKIRSDEIIAYDLNEDLFSIERDIGK